jgi:hypothetical protein
VWIEELRLNGGRVSTRLGRLFRLLVLSILN